MRGRGIRNQAASILEHKCYRSAAW